MGSAAVDAARAVDYVGAGTVEFIVEDGAFYFMEMNTRLQVEHPVTEMITGQELVEWQLRVAAGERLPLTQDQLDIEATPSRCASTPRILRAISCLRSARSPICRSPAEPDRSRRYRRSAGDRITPNYDPMIAKLIVWGEDRGAALRQLAGALAEYEVVGVHTNLGLLRAIVNHPAFERAEFDTGFIGRHGHELAASTAGTLSAVEETVWAAASLAALADLRKEARIHASQSADRWSPWTVADAWRVNGEGYQDLSFHRDGQDTTLRAYPQEDGRFRLDLPGGMVLADTVETASAVNVRVDGVLHRVCVVRRGAEITVILDGRNQC